VLSTRYLLDSSAILNCFDFSFQPGNEYLMPPKAADECLDLRSRELVQSALQSGLLRLHSPSQASLESAKARARALGTRLSAADLDVVAVALDLAGEGKPFTTLSDDFSLQNTLKSLKLPFEGVLRGKIRRQKAFSPPNPTNNVNL